MDGGPIGEPIPQCRHPQIVEQFGERCKQVLNLIISVALIFQGAFQGGGHRFPPQARRFSYGMTPSGQLRTCWPSPKIR